MMFTLSLLYIYLYISITIIIFYMFSSLIPIQYLVNYSLNLLVIFIKKYTIYNVFFFNIFLCLSGLPPVGLFLIKFNLLTFIINQSHIITVFILYFVFLINMFFYLQLFNFKNTKHKINHNVNLTIFKYWYTSNYRYLLNLNSNTYLYLYISIFIFYFFYFFIWYITDFFFIFHYFVLNIVNKKSIN